jgi:hypothetical protein
MFEVPQAAIDIAEKTWHEGTNSEKLAFFAFESDEPNDMITFKFLYWVYRMYPRYIQSAPANFHRQMADNMLNAYYGRKNYANLGFRGCAKTTYAKLFIAFALLNDLDHKRKFIKVLARNLSNSKGMVTDIFNLIVEVKPLYGNLFPKRKEVKGEETMLVFTTVDGVKLMAGTVGMTQRGHIQDAYRPDFLIFDDVEDRESISSLSQTESTIWRIDEAIQGLSADGSYMMLGNYISDEGVVQWFINKPNIVVDKIAIVDEEGNPTWPDRYDKEKIEKMKGDADDWYGEYMADPTRADSAFFDRDLVEADLARSVQPHRESNGVRYWGEYQRFNKYGLGADTSEGIGRDANTFAVFDFGNQPDDPAILVATYMNNRIPPDLFATPLRETAEEYGTCIVAPEANNTGHSTLAALRGYPNIYRQTDDVSKRMTVTTERFGWRTTRKSKPMMFFEFRKAYNEGKIIIRDKNVLKEMRSYTTMDMADTKVGLATRHHDLLMAVVIAYQMRKYAIITESSSYYVEDEPVYSDIGI